jgi:hypothetical protein
LQYHYSIDNVGEIFWVRPHEATLWHAGNLAVNRTSLAIKLDGYFHPGINQQPTKEQLEALQQLLDKLCFQHPEFPATQQNVFGHREITATACPGDLMINRVISYRNSKVVSLDGTTYDWPEYQPSTPAPAPEVPAPTPPSVEVNYRVFKGGKQIGAYKTDTNAWNKYKAESADNILTSSGQDVTAQLKAKFEPVVPPPAPAVVNFRVIGNDGKQIGAYKTEDNAWNKYLSVLGAAKIVDSQGKDVTPQFIEKYRPTPTQTPVPTPESTELKQMAMDIGWIKATLQWLVDAFKSVFNLK